MATKTVSAAGGNWSSGATWVGGVLPAVGDDIVANGTSGSLTVDSTRNCLTINFTGYTNTFTISNGATLNITGTTITMSASGMTFTTGTTGVLSISAGNQLAVAIAFNGVTIPNLTLGKSTFPQLQTVTISGSSPTVQNLTTSSGVATQVTLAGVNLIVNASLSILGGTSITGLPFTITGTCTFNTQGNISGGFNVSAGSTVVLASILQIGGGTVTFAVGSFLSNPSNFALYNNFSGTILNTAPVTWYSFTQTTPGTTFITSNFNIGVGGINIGSIAVFGFNGAFNVNVSGSVVCGPIISLNTLSILNLTGSGNLTTAGFTLGTVNIATGATYAITGATLALSTCTFNLVGTATCSVPAIHTFTLTSSTLTTNNTPTGANIVGGSEIQWKNINIIFTNTITYTTTVLGNLTGQSGAVNAINTGKMLVYGNLSTIAPFSGTSTIEFTGGVAATWGNGTYQNNIVVNKSSGAVVTTGTAITWGLAGRSLTMNTAVNFATNSTTFTLVGTPLTINNSFGNLFFNLITPASTVNINGATTPITNNLTLSGLGATFAGAYGWTCKNLICSTAGALSITLQQAVAYRTTAGVAITGGTSGLRPTMRSSLVGTDAIWTLDFGATQSLIYVNGIDIDSSGGQTIWSFGVLITNVNTSINWNPGVPLRTVAYTFVN